MLSPPARVAPARWFDNCPIGRSQITEAILTPELSAPSFRVATTHITQRIAAPGDSGARVFDIARRILCAGRPGHRHTDSGMAQRIFPIGAVGSKCC